MELKGQGWVLARVEGSHHVMVKEGHRPIPVPVHGTRDLPTGIVAATRSEARQP